MELSSTNQPNGELLRPMVESTHEPCIREPYMSHTDEVFGSFGSYRARSPAESALVTITCSRPCLIGIAQTLLMFILSRALRQLQLGPRFVNRAVFAAARAVTCIRRAAPRPERKVGARATRGTHYTDDHPRPHCAATPTPATAHAHVLHARHHAPCPPNLHAM